MYFNQMLKLNLSANAVKDPFLTDVMFYLKKKNYNWKICIKTKKKKIEITDL